MVNWPEEEMLKVNTNMEQGQYSSPFFLAHQLRIFALNCVYLSILTYNDE